MNMRETTPGISAEIVGELINLAGRQRMLSAYQDELRSVEAVASKRQAAIVDELAAISLRANIVALNARGAAARAGQFGREFAVITAELAHVLGEMDRLVQRVVGKPEARDSASERHSGFRNQRMHARVAG